LSLSRSSSQGWSIYSAFSFAISACSVCWALSFAASFWPGLAITFRPLGLEMDSGFILLSAATLLPAVYCFLRFPECRSAIWKVRANWKVYGVSVFVGLSLPCSSYLGTHFYAFPWGQDAALHLARVFAWNLLMAPFWEEIVWRGTFLGRLSSFSTPLSGILWMSLGWTIWHGGYLGFLYSQGVPTDALTTLTFTYFGLGVVLGSVFELAQGSLWPGVILHTGFNAATAVYYSEFDRASEFGSYLSEMIFVLLAAGLFLAVVLRRIKKVDIIESNT